MKQLILSSLLATMAVSCTQAPQYTITGTVDNAELNGKQIYLYAYGKADALPMDSALIENGAFTMEGTQDAPMLAMLATEAKALSMRSSGVNLPYAPAFVLENAAFKAELTEKPTISGTPENDAYKAFQAEVGTLRATMTEANYEEVEGKVSDLIMQYAGKHAQSMTTAKILVDFRYTLDEGARRQILAQSKGAFSSLPGIDAMEQLLATLEKVAIGKKFTDFPMADVKGKASKLSDYVGNGKVVLIDFWASWCPPCRRDMPFLVDLHKKYAAKGFDIVGVSLDSKQDAWEKGIKDLHITWAQLSDLKGWKNEGAALYGVNSIPHTVLVDKDGTIVAKNLHGEKLEAKVSELLQ